MRKLIYFIVMVILCWVLTVSIIQRFKCPELTETELFLRMPNSFICDFITEKQLSNLYI